MNRMAVTNCVKCGKFIYSAEMLKSVAPVSYGFQCHCHNTLEEKEITVSEKDEK